MPSVIQEVEHKYRGRRPVAERPGPVGAPEPAKGDVPGCRVPFNRPFRSGREADVLMQSVRGGHIGGDGPFTKRCQALLEERFGAHRVLLTTSCTAALEMAALLIGIGEGDEVILPSYTFVSTANAFMLRGARPVFVDIRPDTLNIDHDQIEAAITARTRAIVPVHYAGVSCDMDAIGAIAAKYGLHVVEDAAQGVDAKYKGKYLGTIGAIGTYSFHETKNIACGEGGAIVCNDPAFVDRAEFIREKGTNRSNFKRGKVDKYTWIDVGSSYALSDVLAALLWDQLASMDIIRERRRRLFETYREALRPLEASGVLRLPRTPDECESNAHIFYVILEDSERRAAVIRHLLGEGIQAAPHFVPLHTSPMGLRFGYRPGSLPVTEDLSRRLLRLPMHCGLSERGVHDVTSALSCALLR